MSKGFSARRENRFLFNYSSERLLIEIVVNDCGHFLCMKLELKSMNRILEKSVKITMF